MARVAWDAARYIRGVVVVAVACGWAEQRGGTCVWLLTAELLALVWWLLEQGRRTLAELCRQQQV